MSLVAELVAIVCAAVAVAVGLSVLRRRLPPPGDLFENALRPAPPPRSRPHQLTQLERIVGHSGWSALEVHAHLRPILTEIAQARLARRGLQLDRDGAEARRLLGPAVWELVRPDRPRPTDYHASGIELSELTVLVEALEEP